MYDAPPIQDLFAREQTDAGRARAFEAYKSSLRTAHGVQEKERPGFLRKTGIVRRPDTSRISNHIANITKGLGADLPAAVAEEIAALKALTGGDLNKDWTANGVSGLPDGLAVYDLQGPAQNMVPVQTPIRNTIPREQGIGPAAHYRQILSWSNSQTGTPDMSSFFSSESDTSTYGSVSLRRPPKISYTGNELNVTYMEQGLSDLVTWKAEFAGKGYQDLRELSHTALLYATMVAEEKNMMYARGTTANGYTGPVGAATITLTGGTSGTIANATYFAKVTSLAGGGESVVSNEPSGVALAGGGNGSLTVTVTGEPSGSLGVYNLYVGTSSGSETFQTQFVGNTTTLTTYATGGAAMPVADGTANSKAYDGLLTVQAGSGTGYFKRLNAVLSTSNPGIEFQNAFAQMYGSTAFGGTKRLANPDEIWLDAGVMKEIGELLHVSGSGSGYRVTVNQSEIGGATIGTAVTAIVNEVTRKMVDLNVHPYTYPGTALIRSRQLPQQVPDHPANTVTVRNVQDYMAYDWQPLQMTWDCSTYIYGSMLHFAPAWSGLITNIL